MRRRPGDHGVLRQLFRGRLWNAVPVLVVEDRAEQLVLWLPPGVVGAAPDGDLFDGWTLKEHRFDRPRGLLRLTGPGDPYSLLLFWRDDGSFRGWYVNLEQPLPPTPLGWEYEDHLLDLWIEPDGTWSWLDEDELERAVALGVFREDEARAVREGGELALSRALSGAPPFASGWESWSPDPAWSLPTLPPGWDRPGS